ncbi:MAG TPA: lipid-A-disaccharide synthase, partial [Chitinophagales bacterium]|nr:lipid-A-disaccharide synthase [Chitinophagales bacterium]
PHNPNVQIVYNRTYEVLHLAEAALVTSGTATLETALLDVPQVVCYRANWLSYQIAKRLVDLQFISLVNLIMNQETVTELIQDDLNTEQLTHALQQIIVGGEGREAVFTAYSQLRQRLGTIGAARRVAEKIVTLVSEKSLTKMN